MAFLNVFKKANTSTGVPYAKLTGVLDVITLDGGVLKVDGVAQTVANSALDAIAGLAPGVVVANKAIMVGPAKQVATLGAVTMAALSAAAITGSGVLTISDSTTSTSAATGSINTAGGLGVAGTLWVDGLATFKGIAAFGATGAGKDVTLWGDVASYKVWFDANGDTNGCFYFGADTYGIMTYWYGDTTAYATHFDPSGDTNGAWYFGADTKGMMVNLYGDVTGCGIFWDPTTDTNGTLKIGATGGSKGVDVIMYGHTNGSYLQWDRSVNELLLVNSYLAVTRAIIPVTGRMASFVGSMAAGALTDGYGAVEVDFTMTGTQADHCAAFSSWVNIPSGTALPGGYVCAMNNGIYEDAAATITNAKLIFGMRCQKVVSDTDALCFPFSINTNNTAITALIDCNNISDLGAASSKTTTGSYAPYARDAAGNLRYVLLYS